MKKYFYSKQIRLLLTFLWALAALLPVQAHAFDLTVRGKVSDEAGEALVGATVAVKGLPRGVTTDANGDFSLDVPDGNAILIISYTGYQTQEVPVAGQTTLTITLKAGNNAIDEVVVIGYGERSRKDVTGSVGSVGSKEIEKSIAAAPELALQGRLAGVLVSTPGGAPTSRPTVRIRGIGTFGYNEPLYVIDGLPITEGQSGNEGGRGGDLRGAVNLLTLINPNDIESISVLKDASAAAIYGVRAANGVILINTKRGRTGTPRIDLNASYGLQNVVNRYEMLNTSEYAAFIEEAYANNPGETFNPLMRTAIDALRNSPTYDWQDENLNKNAPTSDYSARIYGGSAATQYSVSGGYSYIESPLKGNNLRRYTMATNVSSKLSSWLEAGVNYRLGYVEALDETGSGGQGFDQRQTARVAPWQPIYDSNNPYGFAPTAEVTFKDNPGYDPSKASPGAPRDIDAVNLLWGPESSSNGFAFREGTDGGYKIFRNFGTAYLQIEPIPGLRFKGSLSADYSNSNPKELTYSWRNTYFSETPGNPFAVGNGQSLGTYSERSVNNFNLVKEFSVNYRRVLANHNFDVLLNAMDQRYSWYGTGASNEQNQALDQKFWGLSSIDNRYTSTGSFREDNALQGYMGRLSYNYAGKYYADVTVRRDGSSKFAPEYRFGVFPSFSLAWRLSGEKFMQDNRFINDLKLRGGWGQLGNQETRAYAFLSTVSNTPDYSFGSGNGNGIGTLTGGVNLPDFPTRDLTWEVSTTTNFGVDLLAANNRLSFTGEYYHRLTDGILQAASLPASVGNQNPPIINIASVRNKGLEFSAGWNDRLGDLGYSIGGNITTINNEVVSTYQDESLGGEGGRIEVGQSIGYLWGYKTDGIFASQAEYETWKATHDDKLINNGNAVGAGDIRFLDINGPGEESGTIINTPDGVIDQNDRVYLGKVIPGYYYGINLGTDYKGLDLSVFFQGVGDVQAYNYTRSGMESLLENGLNMSTTVKNRWTPQNTNTDIPRAVAKDPNNNLRFSDRFVEDAGFFRLKNVQLGYSLPRATLNRMKMQRLRVYVSGTNLLTATKWSGLDPEEVNSRDGSIIPPARAFLLGINVGF